MFFFTKLSPHFDNKQVKIMAQLFVFYVHCIVFGRFSHCASPLSSTISQPYRSVLIPTNQGTTSKFSRQLSMQFKGPS